MCRSPLRPGNVIGSAAVAGPADATDRQESRNRRSQGEYEERAIEKRGAFLTIWSRSGVIVSAVVDAAQKMREGR